MCADDKLFFARLSRYPLICMSEFVQKKTSLDHTFKKRHDAFRSISRLFHHACGRARPPMRAPHVRSQGRQGWLGGELFAFQVIRKGESTCVMSSPPLPLQPIMSPGRRGWPNIWLRRVLTASGVGVGGGGAAWEGALDGLEADSPVFGVCATLRAPSLLNETIGFLSRSVGFRCCTLAC